MKTEHDDLRAMLSRPDACLDDIVANGWKIEDNGYETYFRHRTGTVAALPFWVLQIIRQREQAAVAATHSAIKSALGIQ